MIAEALLPGDDLQDLVVATLMSIAQHVVKGGLIVKALGFGGPIDAWVDLRAWLGAIAGAIRLLLVYPPDRGPRGAQPHGAPEVDLPAEESSVC